MNKLFDLRGNGVVMTIGVATLLEEGKINHKDLAVMLARHVRNDDDNKYAEDREYNLEAISSRSGRVLSVYNLKGHRFYVNTYMEDWVEEPTVIMLTEEY